MKKVLREIFSNTSGQLSYMRVSAFVCLLMSVYNSIYANIFDKDLSDVIIIFLTAAFSGKVTQSAFEHKYKNTKNGDKE